MNSPLWRFVLWATVWHWERVDITGMSKGQPFTCLLACMVDAEKNGFDPNTDAMQPTGASWNDN